VKKKRNAVGPKDGKTKGVREIIATTASKAIVMKPLINMKRAQTGRSECCETRCVSRSRVTRLRVTSGSWRTRGGRRRRSLTTSIQYRTCAAAARRESPPSSDPQRDRRDNVGRRRRRRSLAASIVLANSAAVARRLAASPEETTRDRSSRGAMPDEVSRAPYGSGSTARRRCFLPCG